jgi:hypothetical protein
MKAQREGFESKYPDAVDEMRTMREQAQERREAQKAELQSRRAEFEEKYPEAAGELSSMRPRGGRNQRGFGGRRPGGFRGGHKAE